MTGTLFVVATPLGNLDDLSPRARAVLSGAAVIACEDTRRTARLCARFGIDTPRVSCHKFNERERLEPLLQRLRAGEDVALVSDGGTPGISDPGALLVRAAHAEGLRVSPVAGPSAVAALLSVSGLDASRYVFEGFLPHRGGQRRRRLRELAAEPRPVVFFEAPHRIVETLHDVQRILGDRKLVLGRELTKRHETLMRGPAGALLERLGDPGGVRGEISVAISPAPAEARRPATDESRLRDAWRRNLEACGGDRRAALKRTAKELDMKRPDLQRQLDELRLDGGPR